MVESGSTAGDIVLTLDVAFDVADHFARARRAQTGGVMTGGKFFSISPTTRRKALFVLVATFIFACLGLVTTLAAGRPLQLGLSTAILIGLGIGLFEEFYVQSERGNWLRNMHPLRSILVYVCDHSILFDLGAPYTGVARPP